MFFILPKRLVQKSRQLLPILLSFSFSACTYHFSNSSLRPPAGIRTIAIEAVYDSSREVLPHELLWSAVQRELARSGRILITSQGEADALMTLWLSRASVDPTGIPTSEAIAKDPVVTDQDKGNPLQFRNLRRAGSWTTEEQVSFAVEVEVHDLKSRAIIFKKTYTQAANFKSLRPDAITSSSSGYLHYEEALQAKVKTLSDAMARLVVSDFFATSASDSITSW